MGTVTRLGTNCLWAKRLTSKYAGKFFEPHPLRLKKPILPLDLSALPENSVKPDCIQNSKTNTSNAFREWRLYWLSFSLREVINPSISLPFAVGSSSRSSRKFKFILPWKWVTHPSKHIMWYFSALVVVVQSIYPKLSSKCPYDCYIYMKFLGIHIKYSPVHGFLEFRCFSWSLKTRCFRWKSFCRKWLDIKIWENVSWLGNEITFKALGASGVLVLGEPQVVCWRFSWPFYF